MIITNNWLYEYSTKGGGYTSKQLFLIGISWPPKAGWKDEVIGKSISDVIRFEFEKIAVESYKK